MIFSTVSLTKIRWAVVETVKEKKILKAKKRETYVTLDPL